MKYAKIISLVLLSVVNLDVYGQEKMEVEGAIILANSEDSDPAAGTIRFNPATCDFEGWNGALWASMTGLPLGSVTDTVGNFYKTITIGTQEWMAQNLRTTKYKNGDAIPNITSDSDWENLNSGAYCWYENNLGNDQPYGKLYNWYAVDDARGLCPEGWHVPSDLEWTTLTDFLGGESIAGGLLKEAGLLHWSSPNAGATNASGFTGVPGGTRNAPSGSFISLTENGYWWSSTETGLTVIGRSMNYSDTALSPISTRRRRGYSVRCLKDI